MSGMDTLKIEDWAVTVDPYAAPELGRQYLTGLCPERGRSGDRIRTSRIVKADGRLVTTASGRTYEVGKPSAEYLRFLEEAGLIYDEDKPLAPRRKMTLS